MCLDTCFYNGFIDIMVDILNNELGVHCSKYEAVLLTVPDARIRWMDRHNDRFVHFLESASNEIEAAVDLMSTVVQYADMLTTRASKSLHCIYTYRDFEYIRVAFEKIINSNNLIQICDKAYYLLIKLSKHNSIKTFCEDCGLTNFIQKLPFPINSNELTSIELSLREDNLFVAMNKLFCAVIIRADEGNTYRVFEDKPPIYFEQNDEKIYYALLTERLCANTNPSKVIGLYVELANYITDNISDDSINYIANAHYERFFRFINSPQIQDKFVFSDIGNDYISSLIFMYEEFYKHISYGLYRTFKDQFSRNANGLMRYSLTDRAIALDFLSNITDPNYEAKFERSVLGGDNSKYILRLANENDLEKIIQLNNPIKPYRRAFFVKSNESEISIGIENKEIYVVEKVSKNNMELVCVSVILDSKNNNTVFHTNKLCEEYAKEFKGKNGRTPKYMDFDSVITVPSSRGRGFQRLMLVLAEEIAVRNQYDYICATVSPINEPSKRNFDLNGYTRECRKIYTLNEEESEYWTYIQNQTQSEMDKYIMEAKKEMEENHLIFDLLKINEESYINEENVPRDFMVLRLKDFE